MSYYPVVGNGFVLFEEPDEITGITERVPKFLDQVRATSTDLEACLDIELIGCFNGMELFDATDVGNGIGVFENLKGEKITTERMLCIRHGKKPSMFASPYPSRESYIQAMKDQIEELGLSSLFDTDFDWEGHIGAFQYAVETI